MRGAVRRDIAFGQRTARQASSDLLSQGRRGECVSSYAVECPVRRPARRIRGRQGGPSPVAGSFRPRQTRSSFWRPAGGRPTMTGCIEAELRGPLPQVRLAQSRDHGGSGRRALNSVELAVIPAGVCSGGCASWHAASNMLSSTFRSKSLPHCYVEQADPSLRDPWIPEADSLQLQCACEIWRTDDSSFDRLGRCQAVTPSRRTTCHRRILPFLQFSRDFASGSCSIAEFATERLRSI